MHSYCKKNTTHCYKPHQHSFYQLIWFKSPGRHFVDYEVIEHSANSFFFLNIGQIHYFCKNSKNQGYLFHFNEYFFLNQNRDILNKRKYTLFNEIFPMFVIPMKDEIDEISNLTSYISKEIIDKNFNYKQQVFFLFQSILLIIERLKREKFPYKKELDEDYELVVKFRDVIEENINKFYNLKHYAQLLNVGVEKLNNVTKKHLKDTPANIIYKRKVLEAKRLLANTNLSIKEVAFKLGFDQPTYFTKYFKKATKLTPKDFIKQLP